MPRPTLSLKILAVTILLTLLAPAWAQWTPANPVLDFAKQSDGVLITQAAGALRLQVCSDGILHLTYAPRVGAAQHPDLVVIKKDWKPGEFEVSSDDKQITLATKKLKAVIVRADGTITYQDASGKKLTNDAYRSLTPVTVNGENTLHAETFFDIYGSHEAFYGLGQHQAGVWNYRGEEVDLSQENTNIAIPLLVSTNGYGIFWNNPSRSRMNNRFVHKLYLSSEVADQIDYYFFYGPEFDSIVADYRELTGSVPMFGRWAYGFWQCKNKYTSQEQILSVASKYRDLHIPVDNIVQDWFWWTTMGEPAFNRNYPDPSAMVQELHRQNFHLMISVWPFFEKGDPETAQYKYMDEHNWFLARTQVGGFHPAGMALYDATNPEARAYFWSLMNKNLLSRGIDAWWLDTDEPETENREANLLETNQTFLGNGARYANLFPLLHTQGVHDGQRAATDQKRVFILSRSAFAGAQRNGITAWSGDVLSDFVTYRRQISAGLNYAVSGMPYWTTDIGGFISGGDLKDPHFRELFLRWFQFGTFSPIFRVHGTRNPDENELWSYGPDAQKILVSYDTLRYRMMPYIYSLAWMTASQNYTPMRPLVMDFRTDVKAQNIGDQFLYGPAILVNPVTEEGATSRSVYLPQATWFDFWTGERVEGGRTLQASAPLDRLPLYVRAGSILPLGPEMEYSTQKPADPIELRIYAGANGSFTLYEDENDNYNYEKGLGATIPLQWSDFSHTLRIGERHGSFPGMLASRTFHVVLVGPNHGAGIAASPSADKVVSYAGKAIEVIL
ncbi:MAG TPA: glycoside hydrolase family 31 protein [Acidisarcina sp.]|nr:glycoside hydrolase family 31 protein [Acidisarcina sp.]